MDQESKETPEVSEESPETKTQNKLLERIEGLCSMETDPMKIAKVWLVLKAPDVAESIMSTLMPNTLAQAVMRAIPGGIPRMEEPWTQHVPEEDLQDMAEKIQICIKGRTTADGVTSVSDVYGSSILDLLSGSDDVSELSPDVIRSALIAALEMLNEDSPES